MSTRSYEAKPALPDRMPIEVAVTQIARRGLDRLRGAAKKRADTWLDDLAARGCAAMGYRLTGEDPLPSLCCIHLRGRDRAVVAFRGDLAVVLLVGPHDAQNAAVDVYGLLYALIGHETEPAGKRTKPACCDDDTAAPNLDLEQIDDLVERSRGLVRRR